MVDFLLLNLNGIEMSEPDAFVANFRGKIVEGRKLGRTIGFPTINVQYDGGLEGVFGGRLVVFVGDNARDGVEGQAEVSGNLRFFPAAIHLGNKPTIGDEIKVAEAHLLEWCEEWGTLFEAGAEVGIFLDLPVRGVMKFDGLNQLKEQIEKDVQLVREYYQKLE